MKKQSASIKLLLFLAIILLVAATGTGYVLVSMYRLPDKGANDASDRPESLQDATLPFLTETQEEAEDIKAAETAKAEDSTAPMGAEDSESVPGPENSTANSNNGNNGVDFVSLQQKNPDIYAWVIVEGTNINYPVLQAVNNDKYYLSHDYLGRVSPGGAVFSESYNAKTFDDPHTVLYGHMMKNETFFSQLHKFRDKAFFDKNKIITVYIPDGVIEYRIFAAYETDTKHLLFLCNSNDEDEFGEYIEGIFSKNEDSGEGNLDSSASVGVKDKILSLSTCTEDGKGRYIVQAVKIN